MTPVFSCGFQCGVFDNTFATAHWYAAAGAPTYTTALARSGGRALRINPTGATMFASHTFTDLRWIGRYYIYFIVLPSVSTPICGNGTGGPALWYNQSTGQIVCAVNSLGTGPTVTAGAWHRIDLDFQFNPAGDDTADAQVNGVPCSTVTGVGVSAPPTDLYLGCAVACTADIVYDDVVLSTTAADYPIGTGYVHDFILIGDGAHNIAAADNFERGDTGIDVTNATTDAYLLVDDVPLPSGTIDEADCIRAVAPVNATDYVEGIFGPAPGIPTPTRPPRAVEVIAAVHAPTGGGGVMQAQLNDNGTTDQYLSIEGLAVYRYGTKQYADPPSAATAWTVTPGNGNFNNLRHRFLSSDADPDQCLDGVMIEAEFAGAEGPGYFSPQPLRPAIFAPGLAK